MPTARDIVSDALSSLGEQTQDDADLQICIRVLNRMLGTWANENVTVYDTATGTITLVPGTATYSTTLLSLGRPVTIASLYLSLSGVDYPVERVDEVTFDDIAYKAAQGLPSVFTYSTAYPNGALSFYPTPSAAYVATVKARYPLVAGTVALATSVDLPPGYEAALVDNLALRIAPHFGIEPSGSLRVAAMASKRALQATNHVPLVMTSALSGHGYMPGYIRILGDT